MHKKFGYLYNSRIYDLHQNNVKSHIELNELNSLNIIYHSFAHVTASAIKILYPDTQFGIGPATDNGFFYDVISNLTENDLPNLQNKISEIIRNDIPFVKEIKSRSQIEEILSNDILKSEILSNIPVDEELSTYKLGNFIDLCKGPHVLSASYLDGYSLNLYYTKHENIIRIIGKINEVKHNIVKNFLDHRELFKNLEIARFTEESPGFITFLERGLLVMENIKKYIRNNIYSYDYNEICTPPMMKLELWEKTGHLAKYKDNMYLVDDYALKPMNCPAHAKHFHHGCLSYRDLPYRIAEFGGCFRKESDGGLLGAKRVKHFTQDDGHIFCNIEHISSEIKILINKAEQTYKNFGFNNIIFKMATRPNQYIGTIEVWNQAEEAIINGLLGKTYMIEEGDGAFYGPKIDLYLLDHNNKAWQCGTIQIDFNLCVRLDATYTNSDSEKKHPIVIHRAILGSLERFTAVLLEYHQRIPFFLDPWKYIILPISELNHQYANKILNELRNNGLNGLIDYKNETLQKKILLWSEKRIKYMIIIGNNESEGDYITVRCNNENTKMSLLKFIELSNNLEN